jgi:hypothetical protein
VNSNSIGRLPTLKQASGFRQGGFADSPTAGDTVFQDEARRFVADATIRAKSRRFAGLKCPHTTNSGIDASRENGYASRPISLR